MRRFVVENDGVIVAMGVPDSDVPDMFASGFFTSVFRLTDEGVEYADVDQITNTVEWKKAEQLKED